MTKRRKFIYNGILLTAVGLAMRGVQLLFGAYISRTVGAEGIGLNTLVMTVYSFAVTFATSGISLTVTRLTASAIGEGRAEDSSRILRAAALYALAFSSIATLALLSLSSAIGEMLLSDVRTVASLRILALSLIPAAMSSVIAGYFVGVRRVSLNATVQVLGQVFKVIFTVAMLSRASSLGISNALGALALGGTLTEVLCFAVAAIELILDRRRQKKAKGADIGAVASMAFPLGISAYIRSALVSLEHSLIPRRLTGRGESSSEALSSYGYLHGMALPLILYPLTPLTSFSGLLVPEFAETSAEGNIGRMERLASEALNTTLSYASCVAVFIFFFAEELGYTVYGSFDAGYYISMLAPVIPIMYLDHVTDSILKGIGEHIYSMWVNIADACLSVLLVYVLIPLMGIAGYAAVIIGMESFNFLLSFVRLKKRIRFRIKPVESVLIPLLCASLAARLTDLLFISAGSGTTVLLLIMKLAFALAAFLGMRVLLTEPLRLLGGRLSRTALGKGRARHFPK